MPPADTDRAFAGSIPQLYESHMVPLVFEPYADDLAARVAQRRPSRVLETAAGTGVVTRRLARALPDGAALVATDLNPPMLELAARIGTDRPVEWRAADATALPFDDASFDAVVCQFGVMFMPDKARAYAEARRVLRPGGALCFNVWDGLEHNALPDAVTQALAERWPDDPPRFMARMPHGYHDVAAIAADLARGGWHRAPAVATVAARSRAESAHAAAVAFCQGTPLRGEIEARGGPDGLGPTTDAVAAALARRFGTGAIEGRMQAHVFVVEC